MALQPDRDRKLFEIFVKENEGSLIAYIRTFVRDRQVAEDLFQETMLTAWRRFDEFDADRPLTAWLRGIAKNLIRNAWRKHATERLVFDVQMATFAEETLAVLDKHSGDTWRQRLTVLADCVSQLPPSSRQLVDASYADKQSANDLSELLGLSAAAIRKRLQRIREQLADCIEQKLGESMG
jgi:RNA polymerase sigma-70 factor